VLKKKQIMRQDDRTAAILFVIVIFYILAKMCFSKMIQLFLILPMLSFNYPNNDNNRNLPTFIDAAVEQEEQSTSV
jgi:hypothetical protein